MTSTEQPVGSQDPQWLEWAKRLQAAAQNGLAYNTDPYNVERYTVVRQIAAEMMASCAGVEVIAVSDLFALEVGHATPKIDVRGVVFRDQRVLMIREAADGRWSPPGGWADVYDSPSEAAVREIYEESGLQTRPLQLLALYDRDRQGHPPMPFHAYKAFFLCEIVGGEMRPGHEADDVGFFAEDDLPPLSEARVTADQIRRFFEHSRHPDLPTDFD